MRAMSKNRIVSLIMIFIILFWSFFPYVVHAGEFISPGTPITPGKAITGGEPITGGTPIVPGQVYEPGEPITGGKLTGSSGQAIFPPLFLTANGTFIIPN